jgi:hypothetical protein
MKKRMIFISAILSSVLSFAQPQRGPQDWPNFKRYEEKNAAIAEAPLLVLMGDSITDFWYDNDPDFFEKNNFAGRGISGQTASQMLRPLHAGCRPSQRQRPLHHGGDQRSLPEHGFPSLLSRPDHL